MNFSTYFPSRRATCLRRATSSFGLMMSLWFGFSEPLCANVYPTNVRVNGGTTNVSASPGSEQSLGTATLTGTGNGLVLNVDFGAAGAATMRVKFYDIANNVLRSEDLANNGTIFLAGTNGTGLYNCPPGSAPVL